MKLRLILFELGQVLISHRNSIRIADAEVRRGLGELGRQARADGDPTGGLAGRGMRRWNR